MMFYDTNYRNTRTAGVLAVLLVLMGAALLFGFLFIKFDSGVNLGDEDFNWSLVSIFIPVFGGSFASIMAAISAQKRKQNAPLMVQNQQLEANIEENIPEREYREEKAIKSPYIVYCNYCGEKLERETIFCPQCGTNIRISR